MFWVSLIVICYGVIGDLVAKDMMERVDNLEEADREELFRGYESEEDEAAARRTIYWMVLITWPYICIKHLKDKTL
jgi:hypothetical protein